MRIVTAGAPHLAFAHRMVRRLVHAAALGFVAGDAGLGVRLGFQLRGRRLVIVHAVAAGAGHIAARMHAAQETGLIRLFMAVQTHGVVFCHGQVFE